MFLRQCGATVFDFWKFLRLLSSAFEQRIFRDEDSYMKKELIKFSVGNSGEAV